jgi:pSer/pThr/pTyr-binding forkhead associated (FHA) protein
VFDIANISLGAIIFLLRVAMVFLLYFFLWQVLQVISRGLQSAQASTQQESHYGNLVVIASGQTGLPVGKIFPLNPVNIIGRSLETDIALNDNFLSGEHARLEYHETEWMLHDLNSTNGTFVNGFEVRNATAMKEGDVIRLGRIELKLMR